MSADNVNRPKHYTSDPSGVECITIARHRSFNIGNAIKYLWRQGLKVAEGRALESQTEDLNKSLYYIFDEMHRLGIPVTCRHARMVEAVRLDMENAPRKAADATMAEPHTEGLPRWVRLEDRTDDEPEFCTYCRCPWWFYVNRHMVKCAKCGTCNINLKDSVFKISATSNEKPEL